MPRRVTVQPVATGSHDLDARFIPYTWRDPRRLPAARIAELAAHDRLFAERELGPGATRETLAANWSARRRKAEARYQRYAALRDTGLTPQEAAEHMCIGSTARNEYERRRRQETEQ
jgi:hypothetical protein